MTPKEFDKLRPNEKWDKCEDQEGPWFCGY